MHLLTVSIVLLAAASAQEGGAAATCEAKPTRNCVLDMAAEASLAARPAGFPAAPLDDIVKTASEAGRLDLAVELLAHISDTDFWRPGFLVEAMTRAGRLSEVGGIAARRGHGESEFADNIAPVLVELGRDEELAAFTARIDPPAKEANRVYWFVLGNLRAGRSAAALDHLDAAAPEDRAAVVNMVTSTLLATSSLKLAVPLLPFIPAEGPRGVGTRALIAEAAGDAALARSLVPAVETMPAADKRQAAEKVASALAASGAWKEAVALAGKTIHPAERLYALASIAIASREPRTFPLVEAAIKADPDTGERNSATEFLIRALILGGEAAEADKLIQQSDTDQERWWRMRIAASALAQAGQGAKAMQMALSFSDPTARAWVLSAIASQLQD